MTQPEREFLYRFGLEPESAERLEAQCERALEHGFPHGISAFSRSSHPEACAAERSGVELHFSVQQTGRNEFHYTIQLPHPVTSDVAGQVNVLFGRLGEHERPTD